MKFQKTLLLVLVLLMSLNGNSALANELGLVSITEGEHEILVGKLGHWKVSDDVTPTPNLDIKSKDYIKNLANENTVEGKVSVITNRIRNLLNLGRQAYISFDGRNYFLTVVRDNNSSGRHFPAATLLIAKFHENSEEIMAKVIEEVTGKKYRKSVQISTLNMPIASSGSGAKEGETDDDDTSERDEWWEEVLEWLEDLYDNLDADFTAEGSYDNDFGETCAWIVYGYDTDGDGDIDIEYPEDGYFCETLN